MLGTIVWFFISLKISLSVLNIPHVLYLHKLFLCFCLSVCISFIFLLSVFLRLSPSSPYLLSRLCNFLFVPLSSPSLFHSFIYPVDNFPSCFSFYPFNFFFLFFYMTLFSFPFLFFVFFNKNKKCRFSDHLYPVCVFHFKF